MDPQQELFSYLLVTLKKEYQDMVFDGFMPPEGTPYPFMAIKQQSSITCIKPFMCGMIHLKKEELFQT